MSNLTPIDNRDTNPPKNGWLWVQDHSPELVKLYFLSTAINDWFFWHCVMNKHESENTKNYKCDISKAAELIDLTTAILDGCSHRSSNWLNSLLWEQGHSFPWVSIVGGAVKDNKSASEDASSLFYWPPSRTKEKRTLEDYLKRIFDGRAHIYNGGNYHDSMNWLDIYDMELYDIYRNWVVSKDSELLNKIRSKLRLVKIHAAVNKGQAKKQWMAEASYLGLTKKQAADHWHYLWEYISAKISYHRIRIDLIEKAVNSPFRPRRVQSNTAELTQTFSRQVVDFSEARIDLFADVVSLDKFENVYFL
ncbi:hypothetical protein N9329_03930 [Gammaproteobacteria bacterium]|nr:hypothetical protein [Gammaproteobacteria bacterium]